MRQTLKIIWSDLRDLRPDASKELLAIALVAILAVGVLFALGWVGAELFHI